MEEEREEVGEEVEELGGRGERERERGRGVWAVIYGWNERTRPEQPGDENNLGGKY